MTTFVFRTLATAVLIFGSAPALATRVDCRDSHQLGPACLPHVESLIRRVEELQLTHLAQELSGYVTMKNLKQLRIP